MKPLQACVLMAICLFVLLFVTNLKLPIRMAMTSQSETMILPVPSRKQKSTNPKDAARIVCFSVLRSGSIMINKKRRKIKWRGKRTVVNSKNKVSKNRLGIVMAETRNEWCLLWKKHYRQLSGTACAWLQKIPFPATPVKVLRWTVMWHTVSWGLGELLPDLNGQFLPRYAISLSKHKALYNVQD